MKKIFSLALVIFTISVAVLAQNTAAQTQTATTTETKKRSPVFRANKEQIIQAQKMLKVAEIGKLDADTRAALKVYQKNNGLKDTGTLNRATLEKMNIALTDKQKEIPVSPNSFANADNKNDSGAAKKRGPVFRATKDQIMQAQKMMKDKAMYAGTETGKLDDATRDGLKKFQSANGLKETGTLNRVTLEKMGIALTDKQKDVQ